MLDYHIFKDFIEGTLAYSWLIAGLVLIVEIIFVQRRKHFTNHEIELAKSRTKFEQQNAYTDIYREFTNRHYE